VSRIEVAWIIMRNYLRIFPLFLFISSTPLLGQSLERPQSIVIPISSIGEVSETQERLQSTGFAMIGYDGWWRHDRIRLQPGEIEKHKEILANVVDLAYAAGGQK